MNDWDILRAREWFARHMRHVHKLVKDHGPSVEPTGSDVSRPELWKAIHWRWFIMNHDK